MSPSSPDLSVHDRLESDQGFQRRARSQRVVKVGRLVQIRNTRHGGAVEREAGYRVAMEGHVIQHHHLHQVGNVVAGGTAFFFNDTATTEIYTLSLHDALPTNK